MSLEYISMRFNLWNHPKVRYLTHLVEQSVRTNLGQNADKIRTERGQNSDAVHGVPESAESSAGKVDKKVVKCAVIGALFRLWSLADQTTEDGDLLGWSADDFDEEVGIPGFCRLMANRKIQWVRISEESLQIVNFSEFNGNSAKRRERDRMRKRDDRRDADKPRTERGQNSDKPRTNGGQKSDSRAREGAREIEIESESIKKPPNPLEKGERGVASNSSTGTAELVMAWYSSRGKAHPFSPLPDRDLKAAAEILREAPNAIEPEMWRRCYRFAIERFPDCNSLKGAAPHIIEAANAERKRVSRSALYADQRKQRVADAEAGLAARDAEAAHIAEWADRYDALSEFDQSGFVMRLPSFVRKTELARVEAIKLFAAEGE